MSLGMAKWIAVGFVVGMTGAAQAQDFNGGYAGVFGRENFNSPSNIDVGAGVFAGYNMEMGNGMIAGVEGELEYDPSQPSPPFGGSIWNPGGSDLTGTANLRVGTDVGGALVYGKVGAGYSSIGSWVWGVGGGVDMPVMDQVFMRGEFQRLDPVTAGPATRYSAKVGLGYDF